MAGERGAHADAARMRAGTLAARVHTSSEADRVVVGTARDAYQGVLRGRWRLDAIAAEIATAVANQRVLALDTAVGARGFTGFLTAKRHDIERVVSHVAVDSRTKTTLLRSASGRYAVGASQNRPLDLPRGPAPPAPGDLSSGDIAAIDAANRALLDDMFAEYSQLPDGQTKMDRLADIAAIRNSLGIADSHLLFVTRPEDSAQMIPAATAIGDPFTAEHVSVTVPGVSGTTRQAIVTMTGEADGLRREALEVAAKTGASPSVSTIAWVGYQPPAVIPSSDTPFDGLAQAGAEKLGSFLRGVNTASHNPAHTIALFGHSYGSLVSGIALKGGASSVVDNAVMYGSPGFEATSPGKLGMSDQNFFVMSAPDDPIRPVGSLAPVHGWGSDPNEIIRRQPAPAYPGRYRFAHLQTDDGWVELGGEQVHKTASHGHGGYPQNPQQQMTGFNLAAILLNRPDLAKKVDPQ